MSLKHQRLTNSLQKRGCNKNIKEDRCSFSSFIREGICSKINFSVDMWNSSHLECAQDQLAIPNKRTKRVSRIRRAMKYIKNKSSSQLYSQLFKTQILSQSKSIPESPSFRKAIWCYPQIAHEPKDLVAVMITNKPTRICRVWVSNRRSINIERHPSLIRGST